jgi:ABC-type dipeptide/oligopeptide/nickel transport system ATPase component
MKYLFIIGASGSGKTSLAKNITKLMPDKYNRLTQNTTRPMRDNETPGVEYNFLTDEEFVRADNNHSMIAVAMEEFAPYAYGTYLHNSDPKKVNIIIACIEAIFDSFNKFNKDDDVNVLFIRDVLSPEARQDRPFYFEDKYSSIGLHQLKKGNRPFNLVEIKHEDLKEIRNDKEKMLKFLTDHNL